MTRIARHLVWVLAAVFALAGAFAAGRWWGALSASLELENRYPWALHRKIASAELSCASFPPKPGSFMIQPVDDDKTLIVATLDHVSGVATVHAMDHSGKIATDTFPMNCNEPPKGLATATKR